MSEYEIPKEAEIRLDARARDLEARIENLIVGVGTGTLRRTGLLNQLSDFTADEHARDVSGLSGALGVDTILLSWSAVSDRTLAIYEVQWSETNDFLTQTIRRTSNTFYTIAGISQNREYFARVRALVGVDVGRWSPVYSSASGKAAWSNLQPLTVSNLVQYQFGRTYTRGADWFEAQRFPLPTLDPPTFALADRANGGSFCRAYGSGFTRARYTPPDPLPGGIDALDGDGVGGCIIGPMPFDTVGGFVEMSIIVSVWTDTTWGSGLKMHILRDGDLIVRGTDNGSMDPDYEDYASSGHPLEMMVTYVGVADAPPSGPHVYEIAIEPTLDTGAVNPGSITWVKAVTVQLLELRR